MTVFKLHRGKITNWTKMPCNHGLGYYIAGRFVNHPYFAGETGHTSYVVKEDIKDDGTIEIETRNSRYTLVPL